MMILISSNFIFHFTSFCVKGSLFDYITDITYFILTSSKSSGSSNIKYFVFNCIYYSIKSSRIAKLVILAISFLTSFILALRVVVAAKFVKSGILSLIFSILALYISFLTTSFFTR